MSRHAMGIISFCLNLYRQELWQEFDSYARVLRAKRAAALKRDIGQLAGAQCQRTQSLTGEKWPDRAPLLCSGLPLLTTESVTCSTRTPIRPNPENQAANGWRTVTKRAINGGVSHPPCFHP